MKISHTVRTPKAKSALSSALFFNKNGGLGQNRTADTRIFSPLLYQLS
jgi:hypothetical protein